MCTVTNTINVSLIPKIPYDMVRDFEPVGQLFITTSIFTAHPSLPVKTVKELDLPTIAEAALPGYESEGWSSVLAPAKTAAAVVQRLYREFAAAVRDNDASAKLIAAGTEPALLPANELGLKVRNEIARWAKVVKASGMKID
jgi:tripartite-type tricarboxylate transporter receptor subunit TctC